MPRRTSLTQLKLIGERPVDDRPVEDAFPAQPAAVTDPQLAADILEMLRRHNERVDGKFNEISNTAATALEGAAAASSRVDLAEKALQAVAADTSQLRGVAAATGEAVTQLAASVQVRKNAAASASLLAARVLEATATRLAGAAFFLVDRLPSLGALAAAGWLWNRALPDPHPLQLVLLGLWLPVVAATFWWKHHAP